jgi:hypothetical protein
MEHLPPWRPRSMTSTTHCAVIQRDDRGSTLQRVTMYLRLHIHLRTRFSPLNLTKSVAAPSHLSPRIPADLNPLRSQRAFVQSRQSHTRIQHPSRSRVFILKGRDQARLMDPSRVTSKCRTMTLNSRSRAPAHLLQILHARAWTRRSRHARRARLPSSPR